MEKKQITNIEPHCISALTDATTCKAIGGGLGAEHTVVVYYELEPGDSFGLGGYGRREAREEFYYIQEGTVTFETENGDIEVEAGEVVRFAPGDWKGGTNKGTKPVVALVIASPRDATEHTLLRKCPECGERTPQDFEMTEARDLLTTYCEKCGTETKQFSEQPAL